uniref:WD repeat domain-containing protein 83 n=1 Tax=Strigamia maritima TaxID=126957 RepID=T1J599_STRMM
MTEIESKTPSLPIHLNRTIECKQGAVRAVRFNVDGNYCITCGSDKTLKLWNPHRGIQLKTYTGHGYEVLDAQGSCDSSQIVSGGMDKAVMVWDVSTGSAARRFRGHVGSVNCVRFNEDSNLVISGSIDGSIRAWDCRSKKTEPLQIMDEAKDSVTSIEVSDHEILSGSADGRIRRYDLRAGEMMSDFIGKPISCVSFTHDGQCILISCLDNTVKLFDKDTGELLAEYTGHKNSNYKIDSCLSHTDAQACSGSEDGFVYCWDLVESSIKAKLDHKTRRAVHSISYHPELPCLISATESRFHVWKDTIPEDITTE